ncbi:hypothetical protein Pmani_025354 [Petrolisthes manimaculis]|uniref:Uncharacterized protein n=1 Tax=Petrolisthes manimaculis TaxID=1843537 RepID=A0AAE1P5P5_9EUCA|nr:hypothetical protein Pmani_025354 [Petrolisthes manimaculis]
MGGKQAIAGPVSGYCLGKKEDWWLESSEVRGDHVVKSYKSIEYLAMAVASFGAMQYLVVAESRALKWSESRVGNNWTLDCYPGRLQVKRGFTCHVLPDGADSGENIYFGWKKAGGEVYGDEKYKYYNRPICPSRSPFGRYSCSGAVGVPCRQSFDVRQVYHSAC